MKIHSSCTRHMGERETQDQDGGSVFLFLQNGGEASKRGRFGSVVMVVVVGDWRCEEGARWRTLECLSPESRVE